MTAKTIMVQGTASSAGKSIVVTALCRILKQDGYRVAPFKSQNMALNSFVTRDGGEIGRAQVVQAEAAGVEPTVDMNPILLKPEAEARSQVVVLGKPLATLEARDYYRHKDKLLGIVENALARLRAEYDVVVIEGAGSPAEINLKETEIVNMRIAKLAGAPVLLVGDIDRGGVFASLVGTLELLDPDERDMIKGLVINKFRGDVSLLRPGLDFLEKRTGKPVLGVIPYFRDIAIAQEDSVYLENRPTVGLEERSIDVVVIRLPRISNFDDFDPFEQEPDAQLRYVEGTRDLGRPDLLILPGTKSTLADLAYLHEIGLARRILALAREGTPVIGICGGFQMLGRKISDPHRVESSLAEVEGLGLLDVETVFAPEKTTSQVSAVTACGRGLFARVAGQEVAGYEIHMGQTMVGSVSPAFRVKAGNALTLSFREGLSQRAREQDDLPFAGEREQDGSPYGEQSGQDDGAVDEAGAVIGTYLHGLFHNPAFRRGLLDELRHRKGLPPLEEALAFSKDREYDKLADLVRTNIDLNAIYRMAGL